MRKTSKKVITGPSDAISTLWQEGFFVRAKSFSDIVAAITKRGSNFETDSLRKSLQRAKFITSQKNKTGTIYIQRHPFVSQEVDEIQEDLFDQKLIKKLGNGFDQEIADLHLNFGKSGNCTAFILRKILEKLIYRAFAKNKLETKLNDKTVPDRLVGLKTMINIAAKEKIGGTPFLTSSTAKEIGGVKFLGDTSAHNPLVNVDMKTIIPQMPYIITAYKELAEKL